MRKPIASVVKKLPEINMVRDTAIAVLGDMAVKDGAVIAAILYETADGRLCVVAYPPAECVGDGLLMNVCKMKGLDDCL